LDRHLPTLADILSDIFLNSTFEPKDMDRERQVIMQEINMMEDTPEDRIHVLFNRLCWIDHPLGMCVLGTGETVSKIKKETILKYINRFYTPTRIIITAAGNVEHDALVGHFEPLFRSIRSGNEDPLRSIPHVHSDISCQWKDLEQVHICLGGKAPNLSSDVRFAGAVLNTILGGNMSSRLFQEIREKRGLAYSLYSFLSAYMDTGLMGVYVGTDPSQVNQVLEIVNREIRKIRGGEVSKADLSAAREHLMGGVLLGAENTDVRMMRLAKNDYVFGRYVSYDELLAKLQEVTVDEVVSVAEDVFHNDGISLVTLGQIKKEDLDLACLQFN
jgi:predicted Zn-dependent peptidase